MRHSNGAIDGFVQRRADRSVGSASNPVAANEKQARPISDARNAGESVSPQQIGLSQNRVTRQEIDDSLKDIDDDSGRNTPKRGIFKRNPKKVPSRRKKIIKRILLLLFIIAVIAGAYVGIKGFLASGNIFQGNLFDIFQSKPLKMDANGRTNILIFGTSGSSDEESHPGANLTDSILVLSVDQNKNNAYTMSIPRDLWVDMGGECMAGLQAKINSLYECHSDSGSNEAEGAAILQSKVSEVVGLDLQYYAHVNWSVLIGAVDAVGGVDVNVKGSGDVPYGVKAGSVLDRNFDYTCDYDCYFVKYAPGVHHMDGIHALAFSRARNANGGYGFSRGNFDREANQQKVILALKEKATSAGTLTNIGKVTSLIDALGQNLKTSFETSEIRTLMDLGQKIPASSITSISFVEEGNELMTTGNVSGQSIVQPVAGLFDYSGIKAYVQKSLNANDITRESAHVGLFNGSGVPGYAKLRADALTERGFTITAVDNAPEAEYESVEIYDLTNNKPATLKKLESYYKVKAIQTAPPIDVTADTDFIVIYGKASSAN